MAQFRQYDVTVYLEKPLFCIISECWSGGWMYSVRRRIPRAIARAIKHIVLSIGTGAKYGWRQGWYNRNDEPIYVIWR